MPHNFPLRYSSPCLARHPARPPPLSHATRIFSLGRAPPLQRRLLLLLLLPAPLIAPTCATAFKPGCSRSRRTFVASQHSKRAQQVSSQRHANITKQASPAERQTEHRQASITKQAPSKAHRQAGIGKRALPGERPQSYRHASIAKRAAPRRNAKRASLSERRRASHKASDSTRAALRKCHEASVTKRAAPKERRSASVSKRSPQSASPNEHRRASAPRAHRQASPTSHYH